MPKNPFETFGLTPDLAGELSERELFGVLKAMYRALLKNVHPDVSTAKKAAHNGHKAVELNLAFEALNLDKDPASFRRYRKSFVARRPQSAYKKSLALEKELVLEAAKEDVLAEAYFGRLLSEVGWAAPRPGDYPVGARPFPLSKIRLGLLDVAINQNLKLASWTLGSNYKQFEIDAKGKLSLKPIGRSRFTKVGYIHLLGSIPMDDLELMPILERPPGRFFKTPALHSKNGDGNSSFSVLNRLSPEKFKSQVLPKLRPMVMERGYLFSLNRPEFEETGGVSLEGLVIKIEDLSGPTEPAALKSSKR